MKSLIAIPLVLAGASANDDILARLESISSMMPEPRRGGDVGDTSGGVMCGDFTSCEPCASEPSCIFNLRVGRCVERSQLTPSMKWALDVAQCPTQLPKYDLEAGATCKEGYEPLKTRWEDCYAAAKSMGFRDEAIAFVKYNKPWGTTRPQGCFRKGNGEFHFNDGDGGDFKGKDRILCVLKGQGPKIREAGSSFEADNLDTRYSEAGPEGGAPVPPVPVDEENNGGMVEHAMGVPSNDTKANPEEVYRFYDEVDGWTKEPSVSRSVCGNIDSRERIHGTGNMPWKLIVDLEMTTYTGKTYIGTGFFISKRAIMTAGHCVHMADEGGWVKHIKVCPARNGNSYPFGCQYINHMWTTNQWVSSENPEYDYATITLPDTSMYDKGVGYFGYTSDLSNVGGVNVAGYPGDKDGGTTLWWNYGSYTQNHSGRRLHYMMDTSGGMSGGPVWAYFPSEGQRRVVGIHTNGGCPNKAVRVNSEVFNWMQGFRRDYN